MARLEYGIIHCTDTPPDFNVTENHIKKWHLEENGWSKVGYTDMIKRDGSLINLTPYDQDDEVDGYEITNGARGMNSISRHFVLVGGQTDKLKNAKDLFTVGQLISLEIYCKFLILRHPHIKIGGHNQFSGKFCPGFDVPDYLTSIGFPKANINC